MSFKKVRDAHKTENTEDYCEIIGDLLNSKGEARIVDIANKLGIAQATALSLIHISEPTRLALISYAVFCLKKKK